MIVEEKRQFLRICTKRTLTKKLEVLTKNIAKFVNYIYINFFLLYKRNINKKLTIAIATTPYTRLIFPK